MTETPLDRTVPNIKVVGAPKVVRIRPLYRDDQKRGMYTEANFRVADAQSFLSKQSDDFLRKLN